MPSAETIFAMSCRRLESMAVRLESPNSWPRAAWKSLVGLRVACSVSLPRVVSISPL
jgi:hypothetical protein